MRTALINLITIVIHALGFMIYLFELYYGTYPVVYVKAYMYLLMAVIHLFLWYDERGRNISHVKKQLNSINKLIFVVNFCLISTTILNIFDGVITMLIYSMSILAISIIILTSGFKHGYFKNN